MKYVQLPLKCFLNEFKTSVHQMPSDLRKELYKCSSDDNYVVRVYENGYLEFGYPSDVWHFDSL